MIVYWSTTFWGESWCTRQNESVPEMLPVYRVAVSTNCYMISGVIFSSGVSTSSYF